MPIWEVKGKNGEVFEFDAPDEQTALKAYELQPKTDAPVTGMGLAKAAGSSIARGVADLAGLPGTVGNALDAGGEWVMGKMGLPTRSQAMQERGLDPGSPLSGDTLRGGLSAITGGATDYQPQNTAEEYVRTFGEFAPAAVAGPGGLIRKAAMATVPAGLSESAGQVAEQTIPELEPYARAAGALGGGLATAGRVNPAAVAAKGAPTREVLKKTTDDLYTTMRQQGIKYDSNAWAKTAQSAMDALLKEGFRKGMSDEVTSAFRTVEGMIKQGSHSPDFDDINGLVQKVGGLAREAKPQGAEAFGIIRDKLDEFERTAPLMTTTGMPQQELNAIRSTARQTALKNIKQRHLNEIMQNADTYASGQEAGIRNGIGNLLRSKAGKNLFNNEERTALLAVEHGRKTIRTLSKFGLDIFRPSGNAALIPTTAAAAAGTLAGSGGVAIPLAIGLTGAGTVAKQISPRLTKKALENVGGAIRSGNLSSPTGKAATQRLKNELLSRRMLSVTNANQSSKSR